MHPPYRGVAFLLSLGTLPIACGKDNPGDADTTGNGPGSASEAAESTSAAGTTAPVDPTTGPVTAASTSGVDPSTDPSTDATEPHATTFLTNNSSTSAGNDETAGMIPDFPPPMNPVCQTLIEHYIECFPRYAGYAGYLGYYCDSYIMYGMRSDGQACADAIEAAFACLNAAPCADLGPDACSAEFDAIPAACPNLNEDPETTTDSEGSGSGTTG